MQAAVREDGTRCRGAGAARKLPDTAIPPTCSHRAHHRLYRACKGSTMFLVSNFKVAHQRVQLQSWPGLGVEESEVIHRRQYSILALCLVVMAGLGRGEEPNRPAKFAVTDARIVPVAGSPIDSGTLVIDDGLIIAVGADVQVPDDAWIIDGKGLTVYPGLIDAMTNLGMPAATTPRQRTAAAAPPGRQASQPAGPVSRGPEDRPATTPWKVAGDSLNASDERIGEWRNVGFTSAVVAPRGGIFPGQASVVNLAGERGRDMVVEPRAALCVAMPGRGNAYQGYPRSLFGGIAYIKQVFLDLQHYRQAWSIYRDSPRGLKRPSYDPALEAIQFVMEKRGPVLYPGNEAREIHRAVAMARETGANIVVYGGQQGYEVAKVLADEDMAVLVNLEWPAKPTDSDPEAEETLRVLRFRDRAPSTPAAFEKAGVLFAFYSGSIKKPEEILGKVEKAIEHGLSSEAAIEALTLGAARIFGVDDRLGSLEAGKIANLLITEGVLFEKNSRPKMVFVDGRKFDIPKSERKEQDDSKSEQENPS